MSPWGVGVVSNEEGEKTVSFAVDAWYKIGILGKNSGILGKNEWYFRKTEEVLWRINLTVKDQVSCNLLEKLVEAYQGHEPLSLSFWQMIHYYL